jgi:predicted dehydrogenase
MKRRDFLKAGVFLSVAPRLSASPNEKLNVGMIGVAGMRGADHLRAMASQNIAALCDVDEKFLEGAAAKHPGAKKYFDFREMLEKEKSLAAVVISTPDHVHAPAAVMAMRLGKHVYCEKPMAYSLFEVRAMREAAVKHKVATQMGTQIHSDPNYRRVVELVRAGAIGKVSEVHVWLGRTPWTAKGLPVHNPAPAVPSHLKWDLWLGPAEERPFSPRYHPQGWRCYWNFGGGHLADMGCHFIDLPFWALDLRAPLTAEAEGPPLDEHGAPPWLVARWEFEGGLTLTWYHGEDKRPPHDLGDWKGPGVLFVGDKGRIVSNYGAHKLLPEADFKDFKRPEKTIPESIGHHNEWIEASKGGKPALCNFDYAGSLTEAVLLGNVAYKAGKKVEWDPAALKVKNVPEADRFIRRQYRKGWSL